MKMAGRKKISLEERFSEKFRVVDGGCWLWTASKNRGGYGQFMAYGRPHLAHRISWRIHHGLLPDELHVLHKCDTPACVNPNHLFLGSDADNVQDMLMKGRANRRPRVFAENHGMAKISNQIALAIFNSSGSQRSIAKSFNVSQSTVNSIKTGRQWSTITQKRLK
jgi:hypothetical protein